MIYVLFAVFYFYFLWRLNANIRRKLPIQTEVSWLTFLTACALLWTLFLFVPFSQSAAAVAVAAALVVVVAVNLYIFQRYDKRLRKQRESE